VVANDNAEVAAAYVIGTSSLAVHFTLGTVIFLAERYGDVQLPSWLLPPNFGDGSMACWLGPVLTIFLLEMAATLLGLAFTVAVAQRLNEEETMVYPNVVASASFLDACFEDAGAVRVVAVATAVGLVVTALQHAASALNPFSPMPPMFSVALAVYAILIASFLELIILMRMSGEAGMNMGTTGTVLYDIPVFAAGYRGTPATSPAGTSDRALGLGPAWAG